MIMTMVGCVLLGAGMALLVCYYLMKKDNREWRVIISRIESAHEQEIQRINEDWEKFTCKMAALPEHEEDE